MSVTIRGRTDSVAPVARPCRMRQARWVLKSGETAAPKLDARRKMQQARKVGRLPYMIAAGRITNAPFYLSILCIYVWQVEYIPHAMAKLG